MGYTGQPSPSQQELQEQGRERMPEVSRAQEGIWKWGECGESWVVSSGLPWGMLGGRERGRKGELSDLGGLRGGGRHAEVRNQGGVCGELEFGRRKPGEMLTGGGAGPGGLHGGGTR